MELFSMVQKIAGKTQRIIECQIFLKFKMLFFFKIFLKIFLKYFFKIYNNCKIFVKIYLKILFLKIYIPWRRKWQPTPVFLPGESHGQRNLAGYSPWGHKSWTRLSD